MLAVKPVLVGLLVLLLGYAAYPYVTLYRLNHAVHAGDATTLKSLVNWPAVREGIKEDLCDAVADNPDTTAANGRLPAFGTSFVRGIAANAVDQRVTPEGLLDALDRPDSRMTNNNNELQVDWAFFESTTSFLVSLRAAGQSKPIQLQMSLGNGGWEVTRVWLPPALLEQANAHT